LEKLRWRNFMILVIIIFLVSLFFIPLILRIPFIKQCVLFCLSFTDNLDYKIAYIEIWGVIIGSFIAIYGALWTQRKINEKESKKLISKYACVTFYDLHFSFQELIRLFDDTKRKYNFEHIDGEDRAKKLCEIAISRKLTFNQNWILDISYLNGTLSDTEIKLIYKCYGKLENINRAIETGDPNEVFEIFSTDIGWLVSGNEKSVHNDIKIVLQKLKALIN